LLRNKAYLAGMSQERVAALAEVFVHGRLNGWIRVSLIRRLDGHRRAGHRIALLTAAPDFIAGPLARLIDADAWRATRCAENGEIFVADPPTDMPYGAAKVGYARQLAEETGTSMASAHAYANALSDIPLMAAAGRATAVAPSPPLAALAIVRGWEILSLTRSAL
jgi:phosphoserine phosphatase